jgi:hypothetical protein
VASAGHDIFSSVRFRPIAVTGTSISHHKIPPFMTVIGPDYGNDRLHRYRTYHRGKLLHSPILTGGEMHAHFHADQAPGSWWRPPHLKCARLAEPFYVEDSIEYSATRKKRIHSIAAPPGGQVNTTKKKVIFLPQTRSAIGRAWWAFH